MYVPQDPAILFSWLNTQLRDRGVNLDELCGDFDLDIREIKDKMKSIGYVYDENLNRFR